MSLPEPEHITTQTISHPVQIGILQKLIFAPVVAYTDLLPADMAGNAFLYHLNKLTTAGLIEKQAAAYRLSSRGRLVSDASSFETFKLKLRPTSGLLLKATNQLGHVVTYRPNRAPLYDHSGLPFGKLRLGESYDDTLMRMLNRIGLTAVGQPGFLVLNVRYFDDGNLVCQRVGSVATVNVETSPLDRSTPNGRYFWTTDTAGDVELEATAFDNLVIELATR